MKQNNIRIGAVGETAVALELLKRGYDVININSIYQNYKNADLVCMNPETGKSILIQVKTGTTHNILTGFTSELDGSIPDIDKCIIGPWVFVYSPNKDFSGMEFYVMTQNEIKELITTSNLWYLREWNRTLTRKPIVGVFVEWLQGQNSKGKSTLKLQYPEYVNKLGHNACNRWDKIEALLK